MQSFIRPFLAATLLVAAGAAHAAAQSGDPAATGMEEPPPEDGGGTDEMPTAAEVSVAATNSSVLSCSGEWRFPLIDDREEIGPARFAREAELEKDLNLVGAANAYCTSQLMMGWQGRDAQSQGPCYGLAIADNNLENTANSLFGKQSGEVATCLTQSAQAGGKCEEVRNELTTLRTYDEIAVARAELVLAYQVCAGAEYDTNKKLRQRCDDLGQTVIANATQDAQLPGLFSLTTPLPADVAGTVDKVRSLTDNRYLAGVPSGEAVRRDMCSLSDDAKGATVLDRKWAENEVKKELGGANVDDLNSVFVRGQVNAKWSMCNELDKAVSAAATCRAASVYIDERGEIHLNSSLTTQRERADATLCIDISDFDPDQPLMVTLGLDETGSVPERVWPGETMKIGSIIGAPVSREDVLTLHVFGRAHGASLFEVLNINGITVTDNMAEDAHEEACRMARSWVPVVDHEVPIGDRRHQAVIPVEFGRGRVGETKQVDEGDYVVIWVKDILPDGMVQIDAGQGTYVGYSPPPLVGEAPNNQPTTGEVGYPTTAAGALAEPTSQLNTLAMRRASVDKPDLKRRARYPGSRVLRLGSPAGNHDFPLKVCTNQGASTPSDAGTSSAAAAASSVTYYDANYQTVYNPQPGVTYYDYNHNPIYYTAPASSSSSSANAACTNYIVDEHMFVHGSYHMGIRFYFGYTSFPIKSYSARPIGGGEYEVVETAQSTASYDLGVLLAAYPFGRDPRRFNYGLHDFVHGFALLAGFGLKTLAPWDDFYGGASLQVANGVSATFLAHVGARNLPLGVQGGDIFTPMADPTTGSVDTSIDHNFGTKNALVVGYSFGLSIDFDLFERAFLNTIDRFRSRTRWDQAGNNDTTTYNNDNSGYPP